ncbi:histidine kinase [Flavobacteriaceae bacterium UJ101]|nr:histidine kinase [Flavobacteriaceae bacterium UJ101]
MFKTISIKNKAVRHILFWIGVYLFYTFLHGSYKERYAEYAETTFFKMPFFIAAAYTLIHWQIPYLLNKKKDILFAISIAVIGLILTLIYRSIGYFYLDIKYCKGLNLPFLSFPTYIAKTLMFYTPAVVMYLYQSHKRRQKEQERLHQIQQEKVETELKYLKAQLNPHFLFNTLNNLYSFVVNQSPKAGDMVLRLSEILDYVLYKSQAEFVPITEEVKLIENYIELEKIRYGERLEVVLEKQLPHTSMKIAPLLLLSIVENAFKHGASGSILQPKIKITLKQHHNQLIFNVWNTKDSQSGGSLNDAYKEGIGLCNIKRQLDLIYPNNHQLTTENQQHFFNLNLTINTT